jgi:hypothetical protein
MVAQRIFGLKIMRISLADHNTDTLDTLCGRSKMKSSKISVADMMEKLRKVTGNKVDQ